MHRPLAAAVANAVTTVMLYPVETKKVLAQLGVLHNSTDLFAGVYVDVVSAFLGAYVYFTLYGARNNLILEKLGRTCIASVACTTIVSPVNVIRRKIQIETNTKMRLKQFSLATSLTSLRLSKRLSLA